MADVQHLEGPRLKIDRAKRHISDLNVEISAFMDHNTYTVTVEESPHPGYHRLVMSSNERVPLEWSLLVGDAVHNLRSSLDLMMCDLVAIKGGDIADVYFPMAKSRDRLDHTISKKNVRRAGPDVERMVRDLHPYKGGNYALWALHHLDIADKHRLLVPSVEMAFLPKPYGGRTPIVGFSINGPKDELVLLDMVAVPDVQIGDKFETPTMITFGHSWTGDGIPFQGQPLIKTLLNLAEYIEGIVESFRALSPG